MPRTSSVCGSTPPWLEWRSWKDTRRESFIWYAKLYSHSFKHPFIFSVTCTYRTFLILHHTPLMSYLYTYFARIIVRLPLLMARWCALVLPTKPSASGTSSVATAKSVKIVWLVPRRPRLPTKQSKFVKIDCCCSPLSCWNSFWNYFKIQSSLNTPIYKLTR